MLNESDRNVKHSYEKYCDHQNYSGSVKSQKSQNWAGPGWYRFITPAGIRLAQSPPGFKHCGTFASGWTNTNLSNLRIGDSCSIDICYDSYKKIDGKKVYGDCQQQNSGKVSHCGDYLVYYLPDTPACQYRHCGEN